MRVCVAKGCKMGRGRKKQHVLALNLSRPRDLTRNSTASKTYGVGAHLAASVTVAVPDAPRPRVDEVAAPAIATHSATGRRRRASAVAGRASARLLRVGRPSGMVRMTAESLGLSRLSRTLPCKVFNCAGTKKKEGMGR